MLKTANYEKIFAAIAADLLTKTLDNCSSFLFVCFSVNISIEKTFKFASLYGTPVQCPIVTEFVISEPDLDTPYTPIAACQLSVRFSKDQQNQ